MHRRGGVDASTDAGRAIASLVTVEGVTKIYRLGAVAVTALDRVSLSVAPGELVAIVGPSGSGKTTLLNLMGGLDTPTVGEVVIDGVAVSRLAANERADLRAGKLGFIFQSFNLIPVLTAYENVEYALLLRRRVRDVRSRVEAAHREVGLADRARRHPRELSGGEQQRVAVARALAREPALILADEPTANLDSRTAQEIVDLMHRLNRSRGTTFIFSTHDPKIMTAADRLVEITDGRVPLP
jgi:putative ABC transport system ATP-binding protein